MSKRKITNLNHLKFKPFNKYGKPIKGWSWHIISFDKKKNFGTYISKLEPGTKTLPHVHTGYEEFLILEGETPNYYYVLTNTGIKRFHTIIPQWDSGSILHHHPA